MTPEQRSTILDHDERCREAAREREVNELDGLTRHPAKDIRTIEEIEADWKARQEQCGEPPAEAA